jgi:membrane fusion protein, copper/silver efflux system
MKIKFEKREIQIMLVATIIGLIFGWMLFGNGETDNNHSHSDSEIAETIWTCSMHPQIKMSEPGLCPICGMDLIPLGSSAKTDAAYGIEINESEIALANIQTSIVRKAQPTKILQLFGAVEVDERNIFQITARYNGRIENLEINFTGQKVQKGQLLGTIYSPELISAQKELLEAIKIKATNPSFYNSARNKLKLWNLTDKQIDDLENSKNTNTIFDILSPVGGIITKKIISSGDYVKEGTILFEVMDLSKVWIQFDAYQEDLQWINLNDKIEFTIQSFPGKKYDGKVTFVDPWINENTHVAKVRVEANNRDNWLKPGMFVSGTLSSSYYKNSSELIIPKTAVLWTGKRSIVFVKIPNSQKPLFAYREITLGQLTNEGYVVDEGLTEGEEIVSNGVFNVDAASQLLGNTSMMHPKNDIVLATMESNLKTESFKVFGNCEMCEERIETAAKSINGISKADWDKNTKIINVVFDPGKTRIQDIQKVIAQAGHDTELEKAPIEVYNSLPACCEYRE